MGPHPELPKDAKVDEGQLTAVEASHQLHDNQERRDHNVIDGKRRKRIAKGSGARPSRTSTPSQAYLQMRTSEASTRAGRPYQDESLGKPRRPVMKMLASPLNAAKAL